jgi:hypothetical protein
MKTFLHYCCATLINIVFAVTILAQVPVISSFSPTSAPIGTTVTIIGSNFSPVAGNNIVYFGAVKGKVTAASSTSIAVSVPIGATFQAITVTTNGLTGYSAKPFMVIFGGDIFPSFSFTKTDFPATAVDDNINPTCALADLDGDGKVDLVLTDWISNSIGILKNLGTTGNLAFAEKLEYATERPTSVAAGDLDGDGKLDLVVTNAGSNTVSVFRNTSTVGNIAFAPKTSFPAGIAPRSVIISDLNGDGKPDVAITNVDFNSISVYRNASSIGSIALVERIDYSTGSNPISIAVGDLDGDGKPDLAVANYGSNTVSVFKNRTTSNGNTIAFLSKVDFVIIPGLLDVNGGRPVCIVIGDMDGDEKPDITVENFGGSRVSVLKNLSNVATINFVVAANLPIDHPNELAIGDLDGDGKPDIAATSTSNSLSVFRNASSPGTISFAERIDYTANASPGSVAIGDLDGDGRPDIAVKSRLSNVVSVFQNLSFQCIAPTFLNNGLIVLDASCGNNNGGIWIFPTSGSAPFKYSINGGITYFAGPNAGYAFQNLSAGSYKLRLRDANGCESEIIEREVKLDCATTCTPPTFVNNGLIILDATCANNDGNINIVPTSGTAPFMYSINGGATYVTGPNAGYGFQNLPSGTYKLRLKDAKGCESAIVEREVKLLCSSTCTPPTFVNNGLIVLDASCGKSDGAINIIPTSGTAPFMYSINGGTTYVAGPNAGYGFQNLPAGTYQLRLKDSRGCESAIVERTVKNYYNCPGVTVSPNTSEAALALSNKNVIATYPNPNRGQFKLLLQNFRSPKAEVSILDAKGTLIQKRSINLTQSTIADFDFKGQAAGLYYIKVATASGIKNMKVVVR